MGIADQLSVGSSGFSQAMPTLQAIARMNVGWAVLRQYLSLNQNVIAALPTFISIEDKILGWWALPINSLYEVQDFPRQCPPYRLLN